MPTTSTVDGTAMPAGTDAFSPNVQLKTYQDAAALYNARKIYATTTAMNAETYAVNGWKAYVTADNSEWFYNGTVWLRGVNTNLQLDTTNSVTNMVTQVGSGMILGTGTSFISETVTFPVAFTSTPRVIATPNGSKTGVWDANGGNSLGAVAVSTGAKTTTNFVVGITSIGGTLGAVNWYYDWWAVGTV